MQGLNQVAQVCHASLAGRDRQAQRGPTKESQRMIAES